MELPFASTESILKELERFGYYIKYNVKMHLPEDIIKLFNSLLALGYDKITRVALEFVSPDTGRTLKRPVILALKSPDNTDLLEFDCILREKSYNAKLNDNIIMNVSKYNNIKWDWLDHIYNIADLLDPESEIPDEPDEDGPSDNTDSENSTDVTPGDVLDDSDEAGDQLNDDLNEVEGDYFDAE